MKCEFLDLNGLELRLWRHGSRGPRVLCLHGFLDTGRSFDTLAGLLPDMQVSALDWRGHGDSQNAGPGASFHLLDHVKDLRAVLARLDARGERPDLVVAHSMGGNAALLCAGAVPTSVDRLLLVDALGPPAEDQAEQPDRLGRMLERLDDKKPFRAFADASEAAARVQAVNAHLDERGARRMVEPVFKDGALPFDPRLRGPTPVRWTEQMWLALCARVTAEVVLIRAGLGYVPDDERVIARLAALRADRIDIEDTGHHLHVLDPERIASVVRGMLKM